MLIINGAEHVGGTHASASASPVGEPAGDVARTSSGAAVGVAAARMAVVAVASGVALFA